MSRTDTCALCEFFSLRDSPRASEGIGRCSGYDGHAPVAEPFVAWNGRACVHFGKAPDMAERLQWIEMRKRTEAEHAAPA